MKKSIVLFFLFILNLGNVYAETVNYDNGIYHIIIPNSEISRINFVISENLITNKEIHDKYGAKLTINAGFFDPNNHKSISYIYSDGTLLESPLSNENLLNNDDIVKNWDKISNRGEFRIIKNRKKYIPQINYHFSDYDGNLITSAQAGPILLPDIDLNKEFFVLKNSDGKVIRESASVLQKTARTLIGIKNNDVHIFIVTNKNPMTIYEARNLCIENKLDSAMAFDGGSSTSLDYLDKIHVVSTGISSDNTGRKLKSFMIFK